MIICDTMNRLTEMQATESLKTLENPIDKP